MKKEKDSHLIWREHSRELQQDCGIFDYYSIERSGPEGERGTFTLLKAPDWVTVVAPVVQGGETAFLMVRQFRHGSGQVTVEFPAGVVDPGEDPAVAAARELREETGWEAGEIVPIGRVNPNPAFLDNTSHTYLALDLKATGKQDLDPLEAVEAVTVSEAELEREMGSGEFDNGIMVSALYFYQTWKKNQTKE